MDAPLAIEVRAYPSISLFPQAAWDGLDGVRGAPFLSHTWLETLEKTGCATAPAYLKDNSEGEFVFDWAWASAAERARIPYYPKLVVAVPFTPATASRLL